VQNRSFHIYGGLWRESRTAAIGLSSQSIGLSSQCCSAGSEAGRITERVIVDRPPSQLLVELRHRATVGAGTRVHRMLDIASTVGGMTRERNELAMDSQSSLHSGIGHSPYTTGAPTMVSDSTSSECGEGRSRQSIGIGEKPSGRDTASQPQPPTRLGAAGCTVAEQPLRKRSRRRRPVGAPRRPVGTALGCNSKCTTVRPGWNLSAVFGNWSTNFPLSLETQKVMHVCHSQN